MKRKAIRAEVVSLLESLDFTVTDHSARSVDSDQLPRIEVMWGEEEEFPDEDSQPLDGTGLYQVDLNLIVSNEIKEDIGDFVDDSIYDIRNIIRANTKLDGNAMRARYFSSTEPEVTNEGNLPSVKFTITLQIYYAE